MKLHVDNGKSDCECLKLSVQDSEMKKVENVKYLGDEISSDGRNDRPFYICEIQKNQIQ